MSPAESSEDSERDRRKIQRETEGRRKGREEKNGKRAWGRRGTYLKSPTDFTVANRP